MKQKSTKVPWKLSLEKNNETPHFKEHCTKMDEIYLLLYASFSLKQT